MRAVIFDKVETLQFLIDSKACLDIEDEVRACLELCTFGFDCAILLIGWGDGSGLGSKARQDRM